MNVVIPMAGKSSAFKEAGIDIPKPFIDIKGKSMVQRAYESIGIKAKYHFIVLKEHEEKYNATEHIKKFCKDANVIIIQTVTSGPAETLYVSKKHIPKNEPLIQTNVDQVLNWEPKRFTKFLKQEDPDSAVVTVYTVDPHYSFIVPDQNNNGKLLKEKEVHSCHGLIGTHYWKKADLFFSSFLGAKKKGYKHNDEIYVSLTFNDLIDRGYNVKNYCLKQHEIQHVIGSPDELSIYERKL
tara:strand:- start:3597 stop:4313 length:717 start_codon:yes stop_codon:yes gene_type:complete